MNFEENVKCFVEIVIGTIDYKIYSQKGNDEIW